MKYVLVVDDSSTLRKMVIASLRSVANIQCHEAGNGLEAIERLSLGPFHLLIVDLNMPDMHGLEVVQFVRGHQAFRRIPIIVLTTRGDEESRAAALAGGASVYMTKPFQPEELATAVRELLHLE
ncbi:MAG TPA: response regulator [Planctomycetaceae bacterium]|jgi:two-component system chemotaxis response regulator CheY